MKKTRKTWSRRICGALLALCMIMELVVLVYKCGQEKSNNLYY